LNAWQRTAARAGVWINCDTITQFISNNRLNMIGKVGNEDSMRMLACWDRFIGVIHCFEDEPIRIDM
jgi:hypothetical protein